jgi:hypothetical protein
MCTAEFAGLLSLRGLCSPKLTMLIWRLSACCCMILCLSSSSLSRISAYSRSISNSSWKSDLAKLSPCIAPALEAEVIRLRAASGWICEILRERFPFETISSSFSATDLRLALNLGGSWRACSGDDVSDFTVSGVLRTRPDSKSSVIPTDGSFFNGEDASSLASMIGVYACLKSRTRSMVSVCCYISVTCLR